MGLTDKDQAQYEANLAVANRDEMALARLLQRAAFPERQSDEHFQVAPLYIRQALTLSRGAIGTDALNTLARCRGQQ